VDFDTGLGKPPGVHLGGAIGRDGRDAAACQGKRCRLARARDADDEGAARKPHGLPTVRKA
jgi:hypothetical protein